MRNLALGLVVVALVGLMAGTVCAAGPLGHGNAHGKTMQMAAHHGPHGYNYGRRLQLPPVHHPRVIRRIPAYPAVVYPPVYRYPTYYGYPYYYGPTSSFQYYGSGVGISVGW